MNTDTLRTPQGEPIEVVIRVSGALHGRKAHVLDVGVNHIWARCNGRTFRLRDGQYEEARK